MSLKPLHLLREARAVTQSSIAAAMHVTQPAVSKLERRADVSVGALRDYVAALGGTLEVTARFPDGAVQLLDADAVDATKIPLRKVAERPSAFVMPEDWAAEVTRIRALSPMTRLAELANASAFFAAVKRSG